MDDLELSMNIQQLKTLQHHSGYFRAMFRCKKYDLQCDAKIPHLSVYIPKRTRTGRAYFTVSDIKHAIIFLAKASADTRTVYTIPNKVKPLSIYHIGLFLDAPMLLILALNFITPRGVPALLNSLLETYGLHSYLLPNTEHPHITYLFRLITHYTGIDRSGIVRLLSRSNSRRRKLRDEIHILMLRRSNLSIRFCLICGGSQPNIILGCCHFSAHITCLYSRIRACGRYTCPNCRNFYESTRNLNFFKQRYREYESASFQVNPSSEMFEIFLAYLPNIALDITNYSKRIQLTDQRTLSDNGRPG